MSVKRSTLMTGAFTIFGNEDRDLLVWPQMILVTFHLSRRRPGISLSASTWIMEGGSKKHIRLLLCTPYVGASKDSMALLLLVNLPIQDLVRMFEFVCTTNLS